MKLILASGSPRRREILSWAGIPFEVCVSDADENLKPGTSPVDAVVMLSEKKAFAVLHSHPEFDGEDYVILAADTVVDLDGEIFGKPTDRADAERMIRGIAGREHRVHTGICLIHGGKAASLSETTRVKVDRICENDLKWFLSQKEPYDKAGAYAIQGLFSRFVSGIVGDYFNVMGPPVHQVVKLMQTAFGIQPSDFK